MIFFERLFTLKYGFFAKVRESGANNGMSSDTARSGHVSGSIDIAVPWTQVALGQGLDGLVDLDIEFVKFFFKYSEKRLAF